MIKKNLYYLILICTAMSLMVSLTSCTTDNPHSSSGAQDGIPGGEGNGNNNQGTGEVKGHLTTNNYIRDIVNHSAFEGFGDLLLTSDNNSGYYDTRLSNIGSLMPYHGNVRPDVVVNSLNHLIDDASEGETIFYDIYTEQQKQQDPAKRNTGIFFYRGNPGAPFAVVCPGGGFAYVGSLHEVFL